MLGAQPPESTPTFKEEEITHDDMIASRLLQHVSHQLRRDRRSTLVFLVLASVGEEGHYSRYALCTRNLASVHHNAYFDERSVDLAAARVDDVDIVLSYGLYDAYMALADPTLEDLGTAERDSEATQDEEPCE